MIPWLHLNFSIFRKRIGRYICLFRRSCTDLQTQDITARIHKVTVDTLCLLTRSHSYYIFSSFIQKVSDLELKFERVCVVELLHMEYEAFLFYPGDLVPQFLLTLAAPAHMTRKRRKQQQN